MITADTITDEQIRELRDWLYESAPMTKGTRRQIDACDGALHYPHAETRQNFRARCADILNALNAKETP